VYTFRGRGLCFREGMSLGGTRGGRVGRAGASGAWALPIERAAAEEK
jgi:hypothetical protein